MMPWTSKLLGLNWLAATAFCGPDHQVTSAPTAPPQASAASSSQPVLTVSQWRLVTAWVQAKWAVPVSASRATAGAPRNMPRMAGTARLNWTITPSAPLPNETPPRGNWQLFAARQAPKSAWNWLAMFSPVITSSTANKPTSTPVMAVDARYCRQISQLTVVLQPWKSSKPPEGLRTPP